MGPQGVHGPQARTENHCFQSLYGVQTCFRELRLTASPGHRFKTRFAASSIYLEV